MKNALCTGNAFLRGFSRRAAHFREMNLLRRFMCDINIHCRLALQCAGLFSPYVYTWHRLVQRWLPQSVGKNALVARSHLIKTHLKAYGVLFFFF